MLLKILLVIAVIAAVYVLFFKTKPLKQNAPKKGDKPEIEGSDTVECVVCGTYVAMEDAILSNGKYYCSQECLNQ